jgi:acetylglutamate kinase
MLDREFVTIEVGNPHNHITQWIACIVSLVITERTAVVDIAVLRSLGIKIVLVHGIGHQLRELAILRNVPITSHDGTGITDAATLDLAIRAGSRVSHLILEGLTQNSLKAVFTNAVRALPLGIIKGVDQQLTGKVERIDKDFLSELIAQQVVPVITPVAFGPDGKSLRVNSDLLAAEVAEALHATKIIYLTPHAGLEISGTVRREIAVEALRKLIESHPEHIAEAVRSKAEHAIKAIENGTPRVHIVDGRIFDGLDSLTGIKNLFRFQEGSFFHDIKGRLTHSYSYSLTYSLTHSYSLTHLHTHSLSLSLSYSLTHS